MSRAPRPMRTLAALGAGVLVLVGPVLAEAGAQESRGLGRLFRFGNRGNAGASADPAARGRAAVPPPGREGEPPRGLRGPIDDPAEPVISEGTPYGAAGGSPYGGVGGRPFAPPALAAPPAGASSLPMPDPSVPALPADGPTAPGAGPRLVPQPRVSKPVTQAPPILTRVQLGRSDDGNTFGMFLQIYADGTVIDTEGVHKVGPDVMRPLIEALRAADVGRIKGHCGGPPVDFVQQVMLTVYDQNRGRLQANHFSYSGNPQGCDPAIKRLQDAIDAVQARLSGPPTAGPSMSPPAGAPPLAGPGADAAPPLGTPRAADSIPLTPLE